MTTIVPTPGLSIAHLLTHAVPRLATDPAFTTPENLFASLSRHIAACEDATNWDTEQPVRAVARVAFYALASTVLGTAACRGWTNVIEARDEFAAGIEDEVLSLLLATRTHDKTFESGLTDLRRQLDRLPDASMQTLPSRLLWIAVDALRIAWNHTGSWPTVRGALYAELSRLQAAPGEEPAP